MDVLDMDDYGLKIFKSYWYTSVVIDTFQKFGWIVPMKNKSTPTTKDFFWKCSWNFKEIAIFDWNWCWKRKCKSNFHSFFGKKNIFKIFNCYTSNGAVFAGSYIRRLRDLLEELVFQKSSGNCEDEIKLLRQRHGKEKHFSTKSTPVQPSLENNGGYVCPKMLAKNGRKAQSSTQEI